MPDPRRDILDLSTTPASSEPELGAPPTPRPFVGVHFACCNVYLRIYRSVDGKSYRGRCPRCGVPVNFTVGEGGTDARTFVVK